MDLSSISVYYLNFSHFNKIGFGKTAIYFAQLLFRASFICLLISQLNNAIFGLLPVSEFFLSLLDRQHLVMSGSNIKEHRYIPS